MANMSYCRFQNTELDLRDCVEALEEAYSLKDLDLSEDELWAFKRMFQLAQRFTEAGRLLIQDNAETGC